MDVLIAILYGIVEGITEWLPVSSTGHMILLNSVLDFKNVSPDFFSMFEVVIQLGAILAVVVTFFQRLWPFRKYKGEIIPRPEVWHLWGLIIVACLPAAVIGVLFDDAIDALFYHPIPVALALILVGVAFIYVEDRQRGVESVITSTDQFTWKTALIIGLFQVVAAVFPGTSRSGATIIGALLIGVSRPCAAEFTFFLAVPVMLGASALKLLKFGLAFSLNEFVVLIVGCVVAYFVSMAAIKFLMDYVRKHDFKVFGYYRIALGVLVLIFARNL